MPAQFDAVARINVDLRGFRQASQQVTRSGGEMDQAFRRLHDTLNRVEIVEKKLAGEISRSLRLYTQVASSARNYATAVQALAKNEQNASQGAKAMTQALQQLRSAMASIQGLSAKEAARLQRTLALYERMANVLKQLAQAQAQMAAVTQNAQKIEHAANRERTRAAEAAARLAQGEQKLAVQRQKAAASARRAAADQTAAQARLTSAAARLAQAESAAARSTERHAQASRGAARSVSDLEGSTFGLRSALQDLEGIYRGLFQNLQLIGTAAISTAIDHEAAFAQIERVTGLASTGLSTMRREFEKLTAELPVGFEELARIGQLASQTGIANESLIDFTETVVRFSVTTGVASDEVALLFGRIRTMRNIPISQMDNFASTILALGVSSASTEQEILKVTESIATVTNLFGLSTQATAGLSSALATLRVRPQLSRGALTRVFRELSDSVGEAGGRLRLLSKIMGVTEEEVGRLLQQDPDTFFLKFVNGLGQTTDRAGALTRVLADLGINAVRDIDTISRLANNYDTLADQVGLAYAEFELGTKLHEQSQTIFETTRVKVDNLKDAFGTFLANVGKPFAAVMGAVAHGLTQVLELINAVPAPVQAAGAAFGIFAAGTAIFIAHRIATAQVLRGAVALQQAHQVLGTSTRSLTGAIGALIAAKGQSAAASSAAAAAATRYAAAQGTAAAAVNTANAATVASAAAYPAVAAGMRETVATNKRLNSTFANTTAVMSGSASAIRNTSTQLQRSAVTAASMSAAMTNTAASSRSYTTSMRGLSNVTTAYNSALVTNLKSQSDMARTAAVANAATAATTNTTRAATGATLLFSRALTFLRANWLAVTAVMAPLVLVGASLAKGMYEQADAAEEVGKEAYQAAGGMSELGKAIARDAAMGAEAGRVYRRITADLSDLSASQRQQATATRNNAQLIQQYDKSLNGLSTVTQLSGDAARSHAGAVDRSGAAVGRAKDEVAAYEEAVDGMTVALRGNTKAFVENALRSAVMKTEVTDARREIKALEAQSGLLQHVMSTAFESPKMAAAALNGEIKRLSSGVSDYEREISILQAAQAKGGAAQQDRIEQYKESKSALQDQIKYLKSMKSTLGLTEGELRKAIIAEKIFGNVADEALRKAADGAVLLGEATQEIPENVKQMAEAFSGLGGPLKAWEAAVTEANEGAKESVDDFAKAANTSMDAYLKHLRDQVKAQQDWATNLIRLSSRVSSDVVQSLSQMGPEAAPLIQKLTEATKPELEEWEKLFRASSNASGLALSQGLTSAIPELRGKGKKVGNAIADSIAEQMQRDVSEGGGYANALNKMERLLEALGNKKVKPQVILDFLKVEGDLKKMQTLINTAEKEGRLDAKGKATLQTILYQQALTKLQTQISQIEAEHKVDANGKAQLDPKGYQRKLKELKKSAATTILKGLLNTKGKAGLNDEEYKAVLRALKQLKINTEKNGSIDPKGKATLDDQDFKNDLWGLREESRETQRGIEKQLENLQTSLSTRTFYNQLGGIKDAAWRTGRSIDNALTRSATVSVGYYYYQKNSPPTTLRAATGGWISGPGGPTADKIPTMLSNGEFVVNAKQARRFGALLEAVNSGRAGSEVKQLAAGGSAASRALQPLTIKSADVNKALSDSLVQRLPSRGMTERQVTPAASGPIIQIHNQYPQAEPTSVTINRSLAYAATIDGV